jgi:hypothetical protein
LEASGPLWIKLEKALSGDKFCALPQQPDSIGRNRHFRVGPESEICAAAKRRLRGVPNGYARSAALAEQCSVDGRLVSGGFLRRSTMILAGGAIYQSRRFDVSDEVGGL